MLWADPLGTRACWAVSRYIYSCYCMWSVSPTSASSGSLCHALCVLVVVFAGPQGLQLPSLSTANTGKLWKMPTLRLSSGSWGDAQWVQVFPLIKGCYCNCCSLRATVWSAHSILSLSRSKTPFKHCLLSCNLFQRCLQIKKFFFFSFVLIFIACCFNFQIFQLHFLTVQIQLPLSN